MRLIIKKRAGNKRRPFHLGWFLVDLIDAIFMVLFGLVIAFILGAIIFGLMYMFLINSIANTL